MAIFYFCLSKKYWHVKTVEIKTYLFIKNRTQLTSVLLLCLVRFFMNKSLNEYSKSLDKNWQNLTYVQWLDLTKLTWRASEIFENS